MTKSEFVKPHLKDRLKSAKTSCAQYESILLRKKVEKCTPKGTQFIPNFSLSEVEWTAVG